MRERSRKPETQSSVRPSNDWDTIAATRYSMLYGWTQDGRSPRRCGPRARLESACLPASGTVDGARGRPPRPSAHVMSKTRDETSIVVACLCTSHISKSARVMQSMVFLRTSPHIVCVSTQTRVSRRKGHNSTLLTGGYSICGVGDRWEGQCE